MFTNSFSTLADVTAVMGALPQMDLPVNLVKQYKGLELSQEVHFIEVTPEYVALRPTRLDLCTVLEGEIQLHSQLLPKPVAAQMVDFNFDQGTLHLADFSFIEWKERKSERVQPKESTYVTAQCRHRTCRFFLEDISANGVGLLIARDLEQEMKVSLGCLVYLDFQLTPEISLTHLKGKLRYIRQFNQTLYKAGIELIPRVKQARLLENYVSQRKAEILDEVIQDFARMRSPRGVENLYF